jgi:hypothetical protein
LREKRPAEEVDVARSILDWAKRNGLRVWWGKGAKDGSFFPMLDHNGKSHYVISVWTYGRVEVQFQWMKDRPPFDSEAKRQELRERLNRIPGAEIPADAITLRPRILLSTLADKDALRGFLETLDWYIDVVKGT